MTTMLLSPMSILGNGPAKVLDPLGMSIANGVKSGDPLKVFEAPITAIKMPIDALSTPKSNPTIVNTYGVATSPTLTDQQQQIKQAASVQSPTQQGQSQVAQTIAAAGGGYG